MEIEDVRVLVWQLSGILLKFWFQ